MRATTLLLSAALGTVAATGGYALLRGLDSAYGDEKAAPPVEVQVPGPLRPVAPVTVPAVEPTPDKRRPATTAPVEAPRPTKPVAALPPTPPPPATYEGVFRPGATGEKAAGKAIARLASHDLKIEKLAVTPGRDLEVWLVAIDRLGNGDDLSGSKHVSLGKLKKAEGDQTYRLPPELDLGVYRTLVVWSRRERSARAGALLVPQTTQRQTPAKARRLR